MRLTIYAALLLLFCAIPLSATIAIGPNCVNGGSQVVVNYGGFTIENVAVTGSGVTVNSFTCSGGSVTYDISAPSGFSVVFSGALDQAANSVYFSDTLSPTQSSINGVDFYGTDFVAQGPLGPYQEFIGIGILGGKPGAFWTITHSAGDTSIFGDQLVLDPTAVERFVIYTNLSFPQTFHGFSGIPTPEPATLTLLGAGLLAGAIRRFRR